jgi:hypothetical protein
MLKGMAHEITLDALWRSAGVLAGFQVTAFTLRIKREMDMEQEGETGWFPLADMLNLVSFARDIRWRLRWDSAGPHQRSHR